ARTPQIVFPSPPTARAVRRTTVLLRTRARSTPSLPVHDRETSGILRIPDREKWGLPPFLGGLQLVLRRTVLPRQRHVVILQQAVVRQALDRREIAMRNVARTLEAPDVVRHRAQREVD